ncbi:uroporphyrinogen-III C-methyltransferase [Pseudorhodobacter antarcticus]|nr:uroporphyrinogen-III C-methyltransferase [Pseudorhodobacter antarcticus]
MKLKGRAMPQLRNVTFVGAGPGAAAHLTLGAYAALQAADVVIHDRLVGPEVLALIPAHVVRIDVGKVGFGPSTPQSTIDAVLVAQAQTWAQVVRLKGGDCGIFGRLDEEILALEAADIGYSILPGLTSATVAAAAIGQPLTQRGRNTALRIVTGHDMVGFADHDWAGIARAGAVTAIYMGKKSARYIQGRLMMHGAAGDLAVTVVANISHTDQQIFAASLGSLPAVVAQANGPAVLLVGLAPRAAAHTIPQLQEAQA